MIEAIKGKGQHRARVTCDICGHEDVVACDYERRSGNAWSPNEGQIIKKLVGRKWASVKGKLHCPACDARRRAEAAAELREGDKMQDTAVKETAAPEMTGFQKRVIVLALNDAYDDRAGRYHGTSTDKTIAEDLGGGIRAGWVRQVREEMFGPDGGNEEIEAIRDEIAALGRSFEAGLAEHRATYEGKILALSNRLDGICAAVGPRASARA